MKRTALVVGLLPAQAHRVKHAHGRAWRFRFVRSDHAKHIRSTSDVNVLMVNYLDHGAVERIAKLVQPGEALHYVAGLEKNVINLLDNL